MLVDMHMESTPVLIWEGHWEAALFLECPFEKLGYGQARHTWLCFSTIVRTLNCIRKGSYCSLLVGPNARYLARREFPVAHSSSIHHIHSTGTDLQLCKPGHRGTSNRFSVGRGAS